MFGKGPQLSGEEMHGVDRLAEYQRAKRVLVRANAVAATAGQVQAQAQAAYDEAKRQLRRVAES